jgi:transcriptional antiterminator RfaH
MQTAPDEPVWYCLRTGTKQEAKVAVLLRKEIGLETISLSIRFRRLRQGAPIWVTEALFSGYVFARFSYPAQHRHVRSISGVVSIVQFGASPAEVPPVVIDELRALSRSSEPLEINPAFEAGTEVTVASGPLRGIRTLITRVLPARQRVAILLEILGAQREVEIESAHLLHHQPRRAAGLQEARSRELRAANYEKSGQ